MEDRAMTNQMYESILPKPAEPEERSENYLGIVKYIALFLVIGFIALLENFVSPGTFYYILLGLSYIGIICLLIAIAIGFVTEKPIQRTYYIARSGGFQRGDTMSDRFQDSDCFKWYHEMQDKSMRERIDDKLWKNGRYFNCILVDCDEEFDQNILQTGQRLYMHRDHQKQDDQNAIEILTGKKEHVGYVSRFCNAIPAGLLNTGIDLFAKIYRISQFEGRLCMVAEVYINEQMQL
jgi:hypothetical protein